MPTKQKFGNLQKWTQTTLLLGAKVVQQTTRIVKCFASSITEQKETNKMVRNTTTEKRQHLTGVWQNGGRSAKLNICTSINISGLLNICTSNPPLRQAPKRWQKY
jgi:hypothetical protein